jgi:nucleotide-binding universal stress UspA family protein
MSSRPILVGYDGSDDGNAALDWAVAEAKATGRAIRALFVAPDLVAMEATTAGMATMAIPQELLEPDGSSVLGDAARRVKGSGVELTTDTAIGAPARVLVEQSAQADLVVLGSRGHSAAASLVLGSSVIHVTAHAKCPVVVTQAVAERKGPVVVGVDGSAAGDRALAWAFDHAAAHDAPLEVVHTTRSEVHGTLPADGEDPATAAIGVALAAQRERHPDVDSTVRTVHGRPAPALIEASGNARLVVVGTRGRGAFMGMLLGSTGQALLHHASGTVVVVPAYDTEG